MNKPLFDIPLNLKRIESFYQYLSIFLYRVILNLKFKTIFSKKKVVIGTIFPFRGGVVNHIVSLNKYLKTPNIVVPSIKLSKNVLDEKLYQRYKSILENPGLIRSPIVHSHADSWFINICNRLKDNGKKWVHTYHLPYFENAHGKLCNWQIELNDSLFNVARRADVRIVVSKWQRTYYKEVHGIDALYIPNCVDVRACEKADGRRFIGKYKTKDYILFAANSSYVKNPLEFINLAQKIPKQHFLMIGSNLFRDKLELDYKVHIPANIHIIEEYLDHSDLLDAISACKVFVMTSRIEGLPTILLEALALGKPVVTPDVPGCSELLLNERNGFLYQLENIDELAEKTYQALVDETKCLNGRNFVMENFNWVNVAPQIDNIYNNLLNA